MAVEIPTDTIIDKIFSCFKKITPALVAVSLVSGSILFLPVNILEILGLNELHEDVRTVIGILFLLSTTLIITIVLSSWWKSIISKTRQRKALKVLKNRFVTLAPEQKQILLLMLKQKDKSLRLDMTSGNTQYLLNNNFIYRSESL